MFNPTGTTTGNLVFTIVNQSYQCSLFPTIGQAQFKVLEEANRVLGPIYFFFYMMFVVFILLNMFLSILNETFAAVRHDLALQSNEYEIVDFMLKNLRNWVGKNPFQFLKGHKDKYSKGECMLRRVVGGRDMCFPRGLRFLSFNPC